MYAIQGPGEVLDWHQDWSDWMELGDDIATSTWGITPTGPTLSNPAINNYLTTTFVAGLDLGLSYQLQNTITTDDGRTGVRDITLRCQTP